MTEQNITLEVDRADHGRTRLTVEGLPELGAGEVRLRIDRFALTANNITYAAVGDLLGYWQFFPAEDGWGRVPAMGWADVVASNHPDVAVGGRYYGWFPMARCIDMAVSVVPDGLSDDGAHRAGHAPVYRTLLDTGTDPWYEAGEDAEDRHALLRGLFLTAFLADEFFADADYFGVDMAIVVSASSKTAIGFAQRASERGIDSVVGLTSARNADFVRSLGWYDDVVTYDDIGSLPEGDAVSIDMAGDSTVLADLHATLGDRLKYSMIIGKSHHDAPNVEVVGGPTPQLFFAPSEVTRRTEQWGHDAYQQRMTGALTDFVSASRGWLGVERSSGAAATGSVYRELYEGNVAPSVGVIASLHDG